MLPKFMIFQHIFLPKSDPMHFGLSGPMHLQRGRLFSGANGQAVSRT